MITTTNFSKIAIAEGWSYLIVLFITWPLKAFDITGIPNKIVGMAHGILFIAYVIFAVMLKDKNKWSLKTTGIILLASLIPFGTFYIDKKYLKK